MSPSNCTEQLGHAGSWHERLPHFRAGTSPATGNELQTEYFVPAELAAKALNPAQGTAPPPGPRPADRGNQNRRRGHRLAQRPTHTTSSIAIHFTWLPQEEAVRAVLPRLEAALTPFTARPHWAKTFLTSPDKLRSLYDHWDDSSRLREALDPKGTFHNRFIASLFTAPDHD